MNASYVYKCELMKRWMQAIEGSALAGRSLRSRGAGRCPSPLISGLPISKHSGVIEEHVSGKEFRAQKTRQEQHKQTDECEPRCQS